MSTRRLNIISLFTADATFLDLLFHHAVASEVLFSFACLFFVSKECGCTLQPSLSKFQNRTERLHKLCLFILCHWNESTINIGTVWANVRMARCYVPCVDYLTRTPPMLQKGFVVRVDTPKLMSREWTVWKVIWRQLLLMILWHLLMLLAFSVVFLSHSLFTLPLLVTGDCKVLLLLNVFQTCWKMISHGLNQMKTNVLLYMC